MANKQNRAEKIQLNIDVLKFRDQYHNSKFNYIRASNGKLYPVTMDVILNRIKLNGAQIRDLRFFTPKSIEEAKKKA